jgi:hypothetical protein
MGGGQRLREFAPRVAPRLGLGQVQPMRRTERSTQTAIFTSGSRNVQT